MMRTLRTYCVGLIFLLTLPLTHVLAQSPGGVNSNLRFWIKADAGVTGATNASAWADQSGNGFVASQATGANQPAILSSRLNFNPAIQFDGTNDQMTIATGIMGTATYNDINVFAVSRTNAIVNSSLFYETQATGGRINAHVPWGSGTVYWDAGSISAPPHRLTATWGGNINTGYLWSLLASTTSTASGQLQNILRNGTVLSSDNDMTAFTGNNSTFYIGSLAGANFLNGEISELVVYTGALTSTQQQQIQSYLAIKYGQSLPHNYLASDAAVIWDATANASYSNDITGIGRDDGSGLSQPKSIGSNTTASVMMDKGGAFGATKTFLIWGNDGGTGTNSNVPAPYVARSGKVFKAAVTGTPGAVTLVVDLAVLGFPNTGAASDYALLIDNNTDFSSGATVHTTGATLVGNTLTFTNVSISNGNFFSIAGTNIIMPGGVAGALFWVKANAGVTGTTNVSNWTDQSGTGNNAVQAVVANQPALLSPDINFNPSINFLNASSVMSPTAPPANLNSTVFTAATPTVNTNWRTMFRGTVNDHPLIIQSGGTALGYYDNDNGAMQNSGFTWLQNETAVVGLEMRAGDVNFRKNGVQGSSIGTINLTGLNLNSFGNYQSNGQQFGRIGETIIFNTATALTTAEKERVESYLAIKYGVTLTHNYLASDGTILWNATTNSAYGNDITAIGRDDASGLSQPKSLNASTTATVTMDKGGAFGANKTFLVWGNDGGFGTSLNVVAPYNARSGKVYKAAVTGTPGAVTFSVDLSILGFPNTGSASDYALLIDNDTDFSLGSSVHTTGVTLVGNILTFTNVTLSNGSFFAIAGTNIVMPGGVAGATFWVEGNAGVTGTTNVSVWADQSGMGNNAVQATVANQPALINPDVNFNPSINFAGTNTIMSPINPPANLNSTVFTVAVPTVNTNWRTMLRGSVNDHPLIIQSGGTQLGYYDNDNVGFKTSGFTWLQNEVAQATLEMRAGDVNFRKNGTQGVTINSINLAGLNLNFFGNYQGGAQAFGRITETIIFNTATALTTAEKERVETYLAIKYGVSLTHNYLASDGTILWNTTTNGTYSNDITGIGRDDASRLDQRKSKSSSSGSVLTIEKTSAFGATKIFLVVGDDAGSLGASNSNVHPSYPMRVTRVWRTALTGAPGLVDVSFVLGTGIYNSGVVSDYAVLIKNADADFSSGAAAHTAGASLVGNVLTFTNVSLANGDYFTLALPRVPSPGGIINGLRVWLNSSAGVYSDAGVTPAVDGGSVQRWADQTSLSNNAANTGTPIYNINTAANLINYNPTVYYDGASGHDLTYSVTNQYSIFTSSKMEGTLNRRLFSTRTGNALLGYWNGREDVMYLNGTPSFLTGQLASTSPRLYSLIRSNTGDYTMGRSGLGLYTGTGSFNSIWQMGIGNGGAFSGESSKAFVSELIIYDRDLTAAEQQRVNSYMSIKYGSTLDQTVATNYLSADGTVIWDATANALYKYNIVGIGRDDAATLSQRKSKSVNARSLVIADKGGAFATDKDFVIFGSTSALLTPTVVGKHPDYPYRVGRVWRADVNGTPGAISISFDLNDGVYNTGVASDYALLIKNANADFSSGATAHTTGASFTGSILTFTNVTLADGDFFTLALPNVPSPGGVIENLHVWLKANQGVVGGANVSQWTDQSGNGLNVTQTIAANQPTVVTNRLNFNTSIQFDGTNDNLSLLNGILGTANTYSDMYALVVSRANGITGQSSVFFESTPAGQQFNAHVPWNNSNIYWDAGNTGTNRLAVNWNGFVNRSYLWTMTSSTTGTPSGALQDIYRSGVRIANDATMTSFTGNNSNFFIGSGSSTNFFNGELSEVVIYSGAINATQLQRIQSYLALKYGITLLQTPALDYLSSAGISVYNLTTTHAAYNRDIAGIGRDDNSGLDQRKSKSINTAPADMLSMANGNFTTPSAFANPLEYLVWGNNGFALSSDVSAASFSHSGSTIVRSLSRIWSTMKTGTPAGNVIVEMDMNLVMGPSGFGTNNTADIRLLVDNDATFGNASAGEHAYTVTSVSSGLAYFAVPYADIAAGQGFMTIGSVNAVTAPLFAPSPGGIAADLRLWLKADAGVVGGASVSAWNDQGPYAFSAVQATGGNQPSVLTNRLNFNPAVLFDGVNDDLTVANGLLKDLTYSDVYVFTTSRALQVKSAKIFQEINSIGGRFGLYIPWNNANVYWDAGDWGATNRLNLNWGASLNVPYLWSFGASTNVTPSGVKQDIFRNAFRIANDNTMATFSGVNSTYYLGSESGANFYNGEISEMIIITSALTQSQQQRVQSYMAIKYGMTLDQTTPQNYFASNNAVIFHAATTHSSYKTDIAGIGRDDNTALDQRKSKSINTPTDAITMANGNFTTPTAFGSDVQYLVWGHNGLVLAADAGVTPFTHGGVSIAKQLTRIWSSDKTGTPAGNVVIEVDMTLIPSYSGFGGNANADVRLLIDSDATFGNASGGEVAFSPDAGFAATGGQVYFTVPYASIQSGQGFITLGSVNAVTAPLAPAFPGGVAGQLKLWLKGNAGVTGATNASVWADQSLNGFTANQGTAANQPAITANAINFNTGITFDGTNDDMAITAGILGTSTYTEANAYVVSTVATTPKNQSPFWENTVGGRLNAHIPEGTTLRWDPGSATYRISAAWGGTVNVPYMWSFNASTSTTASGNKSDIFRNAQSLATGATMASFTGNSSNTFIGSIGGSYYYQGAIGEVAIYSSAITAVQQQRIHSYLAIKYGLTMSQATPQNYLASNGTVIYDAVTVNSGYRSDIAGIGRDDASGLDQRKSQSVNSRSMVLIDKGGAFAADRNFLVWGSDNGTLTGTTTGAFPGFPYRLTRIWRTDVTGAPGAVSVVFDLATGPVYNTGSASDYRLIIKNANNDFSSGATAVSGTLVGNTLTFAGVTFTDGDYFTLGLMNVPAPGGVLPNIHFWVRADLGVTGAGNASAWTDQTGYGFSVSQATAANQPTIMNSRVNFNPSLQFDGVNDQLVLAGGINGTATYNDYHAYMVTRVNTIAASSVFFETQAAGGRINAHVPWTDNNLYWDAGSAAAPHRLNVAWGGAANVNYIWSLNASTTATPSGARQDIFRNGRRIATDATMTAFTGNGSNFILGNGVGLYNGEIAELVLYKGVMTLDQFQRIQSYFGIKYGITLDQTSAQNYYASDWNGTTGTVIWDATAAGTYKNDIAGIGRDDNSALNQKQSASINAGTILTIGNVAIAGDNASNTNNFAANRSFFVWGHNNGAIAGLNVTDMGTTVNAEVIQARIARAWNAKETGTVNTLHLRFDLSAVQGVGHVLGANDLAKVRLLVDADGVFATGATSIAPTSFDNTTDIIEFDHNFAAGTGFYFSLGSTDVLNAPLPVELLSFTATPTEETVELDWVTASERNNNYFQVEVSNDGENWYTVAVVEGHGTTQTESHYAATDSSPFYGTSYYRLKQVDFNGSFKYSNVITVKFMVDGVTVSPNPSRGKPVTLKMSLGDVPRLVIEIENLQGQSLGSYTIEDPLPRMQELVLDPGSLPYGAYFITVKGGGKTYRTKLIVD